MCLCACLFVRNFDAKYLGPVKHTLQDNIVLKRERIRITTTGEETYRVTALRPTFGTFSRR